MCYITLGMRQTPMICPHLTIAAKIGDDVLDEVYEGGGALGGRAERSARQGSSLSDLTAKEAARLQ